MRGAIAIALCVVAASVALAETLGQRPPNIVLIIGDDVGYRDYGFMGSPHAKTPHLDALAAEGLVLEQGFSTASLCRPSLQTLLSGLYPDQWERRSGRGQIETLPGLLAKSGYATFQGGKLWEGSFSDVGFAEGMSRGRSAEAEARYGRVGAAAGDFGLELGRSTMEPLKRFLRRHRGAPVFVWFAPMLPHAPHDAPRRFEAPYEDLSPEARAYFANLSRLDARVGELLATLEILDLERHTLVVYLADNGWQQDPADRSHRLPYGGPRGKASLSEPGFRTPIVLRWPGHIPPGSRSREVVSTVDLFPTLLHAAGAAVPPSRPGQDLGPLLRDPSLAGPGRAFGSMRRLRSTRSDGSAEAGSDRIEARRGLFVRTAEWRYVFDPQTHRGRLFRIDEDPEESDDLSEKHPEIAEELRGRLSEWVRSLRDGEPTSGSRAGEGDPDDQGTRGG